jgi:transcription initiation factor TFIIE subunit alpha
LAEIGGVTKMEISKKKVEELISKSIGKDASQVACFLFENGENISEFVIAESLKTPINIIRNILYRLQQQNLVTFIRKKDKKKGWYIYYWTLNTIQLKTLEKLLKEEKINTLKQRLQKEESEDFFTCPKKCLRLTFTRALENNFKCPECDKVLKEVDNRKVINELRRELALLEGGPQEALAAA